MRFRFNTLSGSNRVEADTCDAFDLPWACFNTLSGSNRVEAQSTFFLPCSSKYVSIPSAGRIALKLTIVILGIAILLSFNTLSGSNRVEAGRFVD